VTLSNPSACNPTFVAPAVATSDVLTFQLTVGEGAATDQATVNITVTNVDRAPECFASAPAAVAEGTLGVALDGSSSFDPDGDAITSTWAQTAGPALTLTSPDAAIAYFDAPLLGGGTGATQTFTFVHTVSDGELASSCSVTVVVDKIDHCPLADAGTSRTVNEGTLVVLDGTASSDPDGDTLAYAWTQTAGPPVALANADTATPHFTAPLVDAFGADLGFTVAVDDGFGCVQSASVTIHVADVGNAPSCGTARANPASVWPPNHKLVPIDIVDVGSNGFATTVTPTAVFQDEPSSASDAAISQSSVLVRADRDGTGDGRVYHVRFTATNAQGSCTGEVTTCVPHSSASGTCADEGALYNSIH
jgi:chitinase